MNVREVKRPGRPDQTVEPLSLEESRRRDAEGQAEFDAHRARVGAARAEFLREVRHRSSAKDDTE